MRYMFKKKILSKMIKVLLTEKMNMHWKPAYAVFTLSKTCSFGRHHVWPKRSETASFWQVLVPFAVVYCANFLSIGQKMV